MQLKSPNFAKRHAGAGRRSETSTITGAPWGSLVAAVCFRRQREPPISATERPRGNRGRHERQNEHVWTLCEREAYTVRTASPGTAWGVINAMTYTCIVGQTPAAFASAICDPETRTGQASLNAKPRYLDNIGPGFHACTPRDASCTYAVSSQAVHEKSDCMFPVMHDCIPCTCNAHS